MEQGDEGLEKERLYLQRLAEVHAGAEQARIAAVLAARRSEKTIASLSSQLELATEEIEKLTAADKKEEEENGISGN